MEPKKLTPEEKAAVNNYPGAAVDVADNEKVTPEEVKDYTKELNFNPHTDSE